MSVTKIAGQTETRPMRKTNAGASLMFALRTTIVCEPMTEGKRFHFILGHRFDTGFCPEGEHKVQPDE